MAQKTIIDLFEENELEISELYRLYAQNFSKHKAFWTRLSKEELLHAQDIVNTRGKNNGNKCFELNKFAHGVIRYVNSFVKKQIREAKKIIYQTKRRSILPCEWSAL
ncbi:MAG: hypothetical protein KBD27_02280 [Candidatus Moranbacteria bacterium]|nr:hypothetical protein [Candidatus Moranbacteria bacterium]